MDVPFFLPTSSGPLAVGASIDPEQPSEGYPVLFLPGGHHPRSRNRVRLEIARDLAAKGRAVFRADYPGAGLSPLPALERDELLPAFLEALAWIRDACGVDRVAVGGTCGGASHALALAARDRAVHSVVAIDCPLTRRRRPQQKKSQRLKAGLAAIDAVGTRATPMLVGKKQIRDEHAPWFPHLVEDLVGATEHARVTFVYGENDYFYTDLQRLLGDDILPASVLRSLDVKTRPGAQLYGFKDPADMEWLRGSVVASLLEAERVDV
jgi:pimeloyl-ACP methyl ester carboxylesterase